MKTRSGSDEFHLLTYNIVTAIALVFMLGFGGIFLAFGTDYLMDWGKVLYSISLVLYVAIAVYGFLRLQLRVAKLATELRRTVEEEEFERDRTLTLINSIKDAVILVDDSGYVSLYNAATLDLFDTNVSISRKPVTDIFRPKDGVKLNFDEIMEGLKGSKEISFINLDEDGKEFNLALSVSRVRSSYGKVGIRGYVIVVREESKSKSDGQNTEVETHDLKNSWAVVEGSIENAQTMLERENATGARKALGGASKALSLIKEKVLK